MTPVVGYTFLDTLLHTVVCYLSSHLGHRNERGRSLQFYHRKQSCRHRDIIHCITNETRGKCHLLEAFLLECELIEMSTSESFGAFFKLLQGNLSEYLISERKKMLGSWFAFSFTIIFRVAVKCSSIFRLTP